MTTFVAPTWDRDALPTIANWSESNIILTEEMPRPGPLRWESWQRQILNTIHDPLVREVTMMISSQMGKSLMDVCIICYTLVVDSVPTLFAMPTGGVMNRFLDEKVYKIIKSSPVVGRCVRLNNRDKIHEDGIHYCNQDGYEGTLYTASSQADNQFKSFTGRRVVADEVDDYANAVHGNRNGDPLDVLRQRGETFPDFTMVVTSTPTSGKDGHISLINDRFNDGSQSEWYMPHAACGSLTPFFWEFISDGHLHCGSCHRVIENDERLYMVPRGEWVDGKDNAAHKSFHMNQFCSTFVPLERTLARFNPRKPRSFYTQILALPYSTTLTPRIEPEQLAKMAEVPRPSKRKQVVTAGVDVQGNRMEYSILTWYGQFPDAAPYVECHKVIYYDRDRPIQGLEAAMTRLRRDLRPWRPDAVFIDVSTNSPGDKIRAAMKKVLQREMRSGRWRGIKPIGGFGGAEWISGDYHFRDKRHDWDRTLAVHSDVVKEHVVADLGAMVVGCDLGEVPGNYFHQLTAERVMLVVDSAGYEKRKWVNENNRRNEALDCMVYAYAAHAYLGSSVRGIPAVDSRFAEAAA